MRHELKKCWPTLRQYALNRVAIFSRVFRQCRFSRQDGDPLVRALRVGPGPRKKQVRRRPFDKKLSLRWILLSVHEGAYRLSMSKCQTTVYGCRIQKKANMYMPTMNFTYIYMLSSLKPNLTFLYVIYILLVSYNTITFRQSTRYEELEFTY